MYRALTLAMLLLLPAVLPAQEKGKVEPIPVIDLKRNDPVLYEKDIHPIFQKKCITCHSGSVKEGKLDLATYEGLIKGGRRGSAVTPGKKDKSLLYHVSGRTAKPFMPPPKEEAQTPLSPQELALIGLWIDQGAKAPPIGGLKITEVALQNIPAGVHPVRAVAISADKSLVAASRGNQIHIYEGTKGEFQRTLFDPALKVAGKPIQAAHVSLVESLSFSPDGKYLVSGSFREISVWDPKTGEQKQKLTGFAHEVVSLAFTEDSKLLATGGGAPTEDGEVKFFDTATWKQTGEIKAGHSDTVYGLSFSPNSFEIEVPKNDKDKKDVVKKKFGLMIATCSADKFIKVWEVPSGKFVKSFEGHTHHVLDVGWQADGKLLASAGGDNTVKVWDFEKGEQARTIPAHGKQVTRLLFVGKKNEIITCGGDAQVKMFNVTNGGTTKNFPGGTDFIYAIGTSADGTLVAAGGQDGSVRLYNGVNGQMMRSLLPPDAQPKEEKKPEEKKK